MQGYATVAVEREADFLNNYLPRFAPCLARYALTVVR
jgi:hypothetical protein